jgi:hypothetical protein
MDGCGAQSGSPCSCRLTPCGSALESAACAIMAGILIFHRVKRRVRRKRPRDIEPHCRAHVTTRDEFSFPSGPLDHSLRGRFVVRLFLYRNYAGTNFFGGECGDIARGVRNAFPERRRCGLRYGRAARIRGFPCGLFTFCRSAFRIFQFGLFSVRWLSVAHPWTFPASERAACRPELACRLRDKLNPHQIFRSGSDTWFGKMAIRSRARGKVVSANSDRTMSLTAQLAIQASQVFSIRSI